MASFFTGYMYGLGASQRSHGSDISGLQLTGICREGGVTALFYLHRPSAEPWVRVELIQVQGQGVYAVLYDGPIAGSEAVRVMQALEKGG